jgi:hypothetical protein
VWTPATSGTKVVITDLFVSALQAGTIEFCLSGLGTIGIMNLAAQGGVVSNFRTPIKGANGDELRVHLSGGTYFISAEGYEE